MALAEDLTLTTAPDSRDNIDDAVGLVVDVLRTLPVEEAITRAGRYQNILVALEAELFARNSASGASDRDNENLAGRGSTTTKADAIADAAIKTGGDAARDLGLISSIRAPCLTKPPGLRTVGAPDRPIPHHVRRNHRRDRVRHQQ